MLNTFRFPAVMAAVIVAMLMAPPRALAQGAGSIAGTVLDAVSGAPLAGVDVMLDGTSLITATDRSGAFRLSAVPAGQYALLATYLGHKLERAEVSVAPGQTLVVEVKLAPAGFSESVSVTAETIAEGQAAALNLQRTAPNIVNVVASDQIGTFPDPNAAEAASRIPGISIARDQGEGRYVLIRGTEPRLNSMLIDGERIPAPEGDVRQVQLDAVPADQLQSIEVTKALTPDMDADAIGGAVNLVTKQAVGRPTLLASASGGYNALQESGGQRLFTGTAGRRFANGRLGLLAGFSSSSLTRGSENFEADYSEGYLADFQLRDYQIERDRNGFNASADVRLDSNNTLMFKGIWNHFNDYEVNNRLRFRPPNSRIEHVLKNRNQSDTIQSLAAIGNSATAGGMTIDYRISWAKSEEDQPDRLDTIFRQSKIAFAPNVSPTYIDPLNIQPNPSRNEPATATLNSQVSQVFNTTDRDVAGAFNLRMPIGAMSGGRAAFLKFGVKVKDKDKQRRYDETDGSPVSTVLFPQFQDAGFDNSRFLEFFPAGYDPFPGISPSTARAYYNALPPDRRERNPESDASTYTASERVWAGYAQAELQFGPRLFLLTGLRYEATDVDYAGYRVLYDDGGDWVSTEPVTGGDSHGILLPGFHAKFAVDEATNVRAAYSRTLARPNYYDLVPYELVLQEDLDISRGNPNLKPTTSDNVDVMLERYFQSVGVVSGGVFYKKLHDYIYPFVVREEAFGETYRITEPRNGESASLWGVELVFQNQLTFLPGLLDGLGVYANYTYTNSSATFPGRTSASTLPGQSGHVGNLAVSYEKAGFSFRTAWNFHGKYIDVVGEDAPDDVYYDDHVQVDINASQRLTKNIRVYADVLNLTNAPLRYYAGTWDRPIQEEYYRWWLMFGVKVNF
jgi:TonB-dependent receptor